MDETVKQQAARIEELEQELRIVKRQLEQFQTRQMAEFARKRQQAMDYYKKEYERTHGERQIKKGVGFDEID